MSQLFEDMMLNYESLEDSEKLKFLEWLYRSDPWRWDVATMQPGGLRNFYDPTAKRT